MNSNLLRTLIFAIVGGAGAFIVLLSVGLVIWVRRKLGARSNYLQLGSEYETYELIK